MAVPKWRVSRANTRHRRSQWKGKVPALQPCPCSRKELTRPHQVCAHCGMYKGRQVIAEE